MSNLKYVAPLALLAPLYLAAKRGKKLMQKREPLSVRLEKTNLDTSTDKFAEFKQEREKIAFDPTTIFSSGYVAPALVANETLKNLSGVIKPTTDLMGYQLSKTLFPSFGHTLQRAEVPEKAVGKAVESFSGEIGNMAAKQLTNMVGKMIDKYKQTAFDAPRRQAIFQALRSEDDIIKRLDEQKAKEAYHSMISTAPTLSLDKNAVRSYLRSVAVSSDGVVDWNTLKGLADAEQSVLKAKQLLEGSGHK